jgi:hypothetical protein
LPAKTALSSHGSASNRLCVMHHTWSARIPPRVLLDGSTSFNAAHLRLSVGLSLDVLVDRHWWPGRVAVLCPPNLVAIDYISHGLAHSLWIVEQEAPLRLSFPAGLRSGVRCIDGLLPERGARPLPSAWRRKAQSQEAAPTSSAAATALAIAAALPPHSRHATLPPDGRDCRLPPPPPPPSPAEPPASYDAAALQRWASFVCSLAPGQRVLVRSEAGDWADATIVALEREAVR